MSKEYIDILTLIKEDKLIAIQFYSAHYERLLLNDTPLKEPTWPVSKSHNIFHPLVNKKLCPIYDKLAYNQEATVYCSLCHL